MTDKTKTTHLPIWEQHDQIVNDTTGTQDNHVLPIWEQHQQTPNDCQVVPIWEQHQTTASGTPGTQVDRVVPIWERHQQTPDSAPDTKGYQSARVVSAKG